MSNNNSASEYARSGVNIDEGNRFVSLIKSMAKSTYTPEVIGGLGGFAGFFDMSGQGCNEPVLVSSTDGVGTKLKIACAARVYDTVGIDLVAMSVNDLIVTGAKPLFFLDYIATGKLVPEEMAQVVSGIAAGCREAGAALLGGETAEMPGMYADSDFDLAGFAVGIVDKKKIVSGEGVKAGDVVIGLTSSGFHSNGYSLLRKVFFEDNHFDITDVIPGYGVLQELLLKPTKIYVKPVLEALRQGASVRGMAHITGGGFYDNIARVLPDKTLCLVAKERIPEILPFAALRSVSDIAERELYRVFNMGVGYILITPEEDEKKLLELLNNAGGEAFTLGRIEKQSEERPRVLIEGIDL